MRWIKLAIHRKHDKVLTIADRTGTYAVQALAAAIDWFRWVDAHAAEADISISLANFREITAWPDDRLAGAMLHKDVDWLLKGPDGRLRPKRLACYFDLSHTSRTAGAIRQKRFRERRRNAARNASRNADGNAPGVTRPSPEEKREERETSAQAREAVRSPSAPLETGVFGDVEPAPEWWMPAKLKLDAWSRRDRKGKPLVAHHNETRAAHDTLDRALRDADPVPYGGSLQPALTLVPVVVQFLMDKGSAQFKSVEFACGCIKREIAQWREGFAPGPGGGQRAVKAGGASVSARRADRQAGEFPQPEAPVGPAGGVAGHDHGRRAEGSHEA
jgi:hypothetical protein